MLTLSDCFVTDRGVAEIAEISTLEVLRLNSTDITDKSFELLRRLKHLKQLEVSHCRKITNAGMKTVASYPNLNILQIDDTAISSAGFDALTRSHSIRFLTLGSLKLADKDLTPFYKMHLTELNLTNNPITDRCLPGFVKTPGLAHIILSKCDNLTTGGVNALKAEFKQVNGRKLDVSITSRRQLSSEDSVDFSTLLGDSEFDYAKKIDNIQK